MTDNTLVKMEVDYSAEVDKAIPEMQTLAASGKLTEALDQLYALEKQTRTAADAVSTGRILVCIVELCFAKKDWDLLNENILTLSKKRSQLKQAVTKMVQKCVTYVDETPDKETKLKFIDTLRTVTAGKIYVENERARLTRTLAEMREAEGNITEAATVLQELQVETYGSMEKTEKVDFILEQMRLCLAKADYIRTQIISKKISARFFDEKDTEEYKLRFYKLMIQVDLHEESYLAVCKHYKAIYDTKTILDDEAKMKETLRHVVLYCILSPYDNEQSDLIHRIKDDKNLEELPVYQQLVKLFTTPELINWAELVTMYTEPLKKGTAADPVTTVFPANAEGEKRWADLKLRVVEHNIRIMAKYYTRVTMKRMAELLDLKEAEAEEFLSNLVSKKTVFAKVDRLDGIVQFAATQDPNEILNEWSNNLSSLMALVNKTTHLINKEEMIHQLKA